MKKAILLIGSVLYVLFQANSTRADVATVTLSGLSQTYDGTAKAVTVTTDPPGLTVNVTYDAGISAPTNAGSYTVIATVDDPTYSGSATDTLVINKADAIITFTNTSKTYDGTPLDPIVTTSPPGLGLYTYYFYIGSNGPIFISPTLPGSYVKRAIVQDPNYQGTNFLVFNIFKVGATVTITGQNQIYDGTAKHVTVTTIPPGLPVDVNYYFGFDPSTNAPTNAWSYFVSAQINDPIYQGSATDNLNIAKASAQISLGGLHQYYDGTPKSVIVTTSPAGMSNYVFYSDQFGNRSLTPPTDLGTYPVEVDIFDQNYEGSVSDTFVISAVKNAQVKISGLLRTYDGKAKRVTVTTTPPGLQVDVTYDGNHSVPTNAGDYDVVVTVVQPGYTGSAEATLWISAPPHGPVLGIQSPPDLSVFSTPQIIVTGIAKDVNNGTNCVELVGYYLNEYGVLNWREVSTANHYTNWTANLTLQPGWNTFEVGAADNNFGETWVTQYYLYATIANVVGVYNGLFYETNSSGMPAVTERSAGFVKINVQPSGRYTGKIYIAGTNYAIWGGFDHNGDSTTTVWPRLSIALHLDWTGATKQITGTVDCPGEGWSAPLLADLNVFGAKNPHPAARYTMVIEPGSDAPASSPGGYGYGLINLKATGQIVLSGAVADSCPISQSVPISEDGRWPLFADLYNHQGLLEGWLSFSNGAPSGQVTWIKPANPTGVKLTTYLDGFSETVNVDGSGYNPALPAISISNGTLDITDGSGLNLPLSLNAAVSLNNAIVSLPPTTNHLSGSIAQTNGLMKVQFRPTGLRKITKTATGVVLQASNAAYGAFIGNNDGAGKTNTGAIYLH